MPVPDRAAQPYEPPTEVFRAEAELRAALRMFEREGETLARRHGLTPRQYQLLLQIKGAPDGSERATTTQLTQRLQINQSSVSELVHRALQAGWIQQTVSPHDRRSWWFSLTEEGERRLAAVVRGLGDERRKLVELLRALDQPAPG